MKTKMNILKGAMAAKSATAAPSRSSSPLAAKGEVVRYDQQGMPTLEVWLEDETIWLTQKQMGLLFGVMEHTITYHIQEISKSGELEGVATTRKIRVVRLEGKRTVSRLIDFYNLDTILYTLMPALPENREPIGFHK